MYQKTGYLNLEDKESLKSGLIKRAVITMDTLAFHNSERYRNLYSTYPPNNAFFISFLNYRAPQDTFELMLKNEFSDDLKAFIEYWQNEYGS